MSNGIPEDLKKQELVSLTDILTKERNVISTSSTTNNTNNENASVQRSEIIDKQKREGENLWSTILEQSSKNIRKRMEPRHLLIMGDRYSGKSSFLARLQRLDLGELKEGIALDYAFLDIQAESSKGTDDGKDVICK
jgi:hypothetical protein